MQTHIGKCDSIAGVSNTILRQAAKCLYSYIKQPLVQRTAQYSSPDPTRTCCYVSEMDSLWTGGNGPGGKDVAKKINVGTYPKHCKPSVLIFTAAANNPLPSFIHKR